MEQYNMKNLWRQMCHTFNKRHLMYHGPYYLRIVKKTASQVDPEYDLHLFLYVETEDGHYHGLMEISPRQYRNYKAGQYFCRGGVIQYTKKENYYYMSRYDDEKVAIRKAVNSSRLRFMFIVLLITFLILI